MQNDECLKQIYEETINVDLLNGYLHKVEENELFGTKDGRQWYVPHHPVINPHKREKVRRVCNAAAKYKGDSKNEKLLKGPYLLRKFAAINFRLQEDRIVSTGDIDAMFQQVKVRLQKWRVLGCLRKNKPENNIGVCEYAGPVSGAKSSPLCANFSVLQYGLLHQESHPVAE